MRFTCVLSLALPPEICVCAIVEQVVLSPAKPRYDVGLAHRWDPPLPVGRMIGVVHATLHTPELRGQTELLIEGPLTCRPWIDQFRQDGLPCVAVQLQDAQSAPGHVGSNWVVPSSVLAGTQELLLQEDRLVFAESLPHLPTLSEEAQVLRGGQGATTATPRRTPLATSVALACWWAELGQAAYPTGIDLSRGVRGTTQPPISHPSRHRQAIPRHIMRSVESQWGMGGEGSFSAQDEGWDAAKRDAYLRGTAPLSSLRPERHG